MLHDYADAGPVPRRRSPPSVSSFPPPRLHRPASTSGGPAYAAIPSSDRPDYYLPHTLRRDQLHEIDEESCGYEGRFSGGNANGGWTALAGLRHHRGIKGRFLVGLAGAALLYLAYSAFSRSLDRHSPGGHSSPIPPTPALQPPAAASTPSHASETPTNNLLDGEIPIVDLKEFIQPRRPVPPSGPDPWAHVSESTWRGREYLSAARFGDEKHGWKSVPDPPAYDPPPARHLLAAFEYAAAVAGKKPDGTRVKLTPGMGFDERTGRPKKIPHKDLKLGRGGKFKVAQLGNGKMGEKKVPRVQADAPEEDDGSRVEEEKRRREWVKRAFMHAWAGYSKHAYGHDELSPTSSLFSDNYNGWGATLVDSLDTLLLMNMTHEYNLARKHVAGIDFSYLVPSGAKTFSTELPPIEALSIPEPGQEGEEDGRKWVDPRLRAAYDQKSPTTLSWFETLIRYLGSLLSAYELSGDPLMLDRATELGDWLLPSFATQYGLPMNRYPPGHNPDGAKTGRLVLAEAQRAMDALDKHFAPASPVPTEPKARATHRGRLGTLLPAHLDPAFPAMLQGEYTFGGLADSFYEYLIKQAQLTSFSQKQYPRMYEDAIDSAYEHLIRRIEVVPGREDLTLIGNVDWGTWKNDLQHLTCFAGGMLGLGAKLLDRPHDLATGENVTNACVWVYESSETGIGGERTTFYNPEEPSRYATLDNPNGPGMIRSPRGSPTGVRTSDRRQIGRPETIESVFYLWRLTADRKWQDLGWTMFVKWVEHAITESGFATIHNTNAVPITQDDSMESFVLGETLKYYYLLFSPRDFMSLDDWVFSTEAHPLWIPKPSAPRPPMSSWAGPEEDGFASSFVSQLGEGTWVQKWARVQQAAALAGASRRGAVPGRADRQAPPGGARPPGAPARGFVRPSDEELEAAKAAAREKAPTIDKLGARPPPKGALQGGGRGMGGRPV
ncbi:hypothetical protein JCM10213v2_000478 [Rhodosporidiobolus nylandii]